MHPRCMLDRADHITREHAGPRPCVARQLAWPEGSRPPHAAELARGSPMTEQRGIWTAVKTYSLPSSFSGVTSERHQPVT